MSASSSPDSQQRVADRNIDNLAPELLLNIVTRLPDLLSLDCLLRASPAVNRLFDQYAVEITEAVLKSGVTYHHTQVIIRIIALIRSSTLPITSLKDFKRRVTHHAMYYRIRGVGSKPNLTGLDYNPWDCYPVSEGGLGPQHLSKTTSPAVLRGILATNRLIMYHTLECLDEYLVGFRALRPRHVVNPRPGSNLPIETFLPEGVLAAKSEYFECQDSGPPSWQEEQRVIRAFWRSQVLYDLKAAATQGLLNWPREDIKTLLAYPTPSSSTVLPMKDTPFKILYDVQLPGPDLDIPSQWPSMPHPERAELDSIMRYVERKWSRHPSGPSNPTQNWLPPPLHETQRKWPIATPIGKAWSEILSPASGSHHARGTWGHPPRPTHEKYGFPFWDYKRLWQSGFVSPPQPGSRKSDIRWHVYWFAWQSILSVEEIEENERLRRENDRLQREQLEDCLFATQRPYNRPQPPRDVLSPWEEARLLRERMEREQLEREPLERVRTILGKLCVIC